MVQPARQEDFIIPVDWMFQEKKRVLTTSIRHQYPVGDLQETFKIKRSGLCLTNNRHPGWLDFPLTADTVTHYKFLGQARGGLRRPVFFKH